MRKQTFRRDESLQILQSTDAVLPLIQLLEFVGYLVQAWAAILLRPRHALLN